MATGQDALNIVLRARNEAAAPVQNLRNQLAGLATTADGATKTMQSMMRSLQLLGQARAGLGALNVATELFSGNVERAKEALFQMPFGIGEIARLTDTLLLKWSGVADQIERAKRGTTITTVASNAARDTRSSVATFAQNVRDTVRQARGERSLLGLQGRPRIDEQQRQDLTENRTTILREFQSSRDAIMKKFGEDMTRVMAEQAKAGPAPPKMEQVRFRSPRGIMFDSQPSSGTIETGQVSNAYRVWASEVNAGRVAMAQLRMGAEIALQELRSGTRTKLTETAMTISAGAREDRINEMRAEVMPKVGSVISSFADMIGTLRTGAEAGASGELARDSKQALQQRKEQQQALQHLGNKMDELIQAVKGIKVQEFGVGVFN